MLLQCTSCENVFDEVELTDAQECPKCFSGNWVYGHIDDEEDTGGADD